MIGLQINDRILDGGLLAFDLKDILRAIGSETRNWTWSVLGCGSQENLFEATGVGGEELETIQRIGARITGPRLVGLAERTRQVIWGEFRAYRDRSAEAELVRIIAFDSSWYEVWSREEAIMDRVRRAFIDTKAISHSTTVPRWPEASN